jgi:WD40 repeat protein
VLNLVENGRVRSVVWSPDGKNIASGSDDKTIKVWNAQTGQCVSTLSGHSGYVTASSYSCFFSNVWCVLTIEYFTGLSGVFASLQMASTLPVEAGTKP